MNQPDPQILFKLFKVRMPFGKYKDSFIADLPIYYLEWFAAQGFPKGELGMLLSTVYEIKVNGLTGMLEAIRKMEKKGS